MNHPTILRNRMPKLADIQCSTLRFQPGDRVIAKTTHRLNADQLRKLRKSILKFAGCEVEVLIYCMMDMELTVEKR